MSRSEWLNEPRVQAAIAKLVESAPPLSADQLDLLRRTGYFRSAQPGAQAAARPRDAENRRSTVSTDEHSNGQVTPGF